MICDFYLTLLKSNKNQNTKDVCLGWLKLRAYLDKRKNRGTEQIKTQMIEIKKKFKEYEEDIESEYCNYSAYKKLIKLQNELFNEI